MIRFTVTGLTGEEGEDVALELDRNGEIGRLTVRIENRPTELDLNALTINQIAELAEFFVQATEALNGAKTGAAMRRADELRNDVKQQGGALPGISVADLSAAE